MTAPQLSVITATRGRPRELLLKLEALRRQTLPYRDFEWIICSDGPAGDELAAIRAASPPFAVELLELEQPQGPGAARNAAAARARGTYLYLSDDDCLPAPATLQRHLEAQLASPAVYVGGIDFEVEGTTVSSWRPAAVNYWNVNGANTSLPAGSFRKVGGFDGRLTGYGGEDILLGYLLKRAGLSIARLEGAATTHLGPDPQSGVDLGKSRAAGRNAVRIAVLHPELAGRLGVQPLLLRAELLFERLLPRVPRRLRGEFAYARGAHEEWRALRSTSRQVLLVSNGHGEDVIGAALALALREQGFEPRAVPLVGRGDTYERLGVPVLGPRKELPSGGFLYQGGGLLRKDLRAGLLGSLVGQWRTIAAAARGSRAVLAVGDWYALLAATLFGPRPLFHLQPAVSVLAWPQDMPAWRQPFGPLERLLMRQAKEVWPRDAASTTWLQQRGVPHATFAGNPMLDALFDEGPLELPEPYLLLLPGTRGDVADSLPLMLEAAGKLAGSGLTPVIAWAGGDPGAIGTPGWSCEPSGRSRGVTHTFRDASGNEVYLVQQAFGAALRGAAVAISTSGTAAEQAAGYGVPLVAFPTGGPQYTKEFAAAQKRALGDALTLCEADPVSISEAVRCILASPQVQAAAREAGIRAMGEPGAARRIAQQIAHRLGEKDHE